MDLDHADPVGNNSEYAEPDGNVVVVVKVVNRPHDEGNNDYPFEPHCVLGVDIPGEHAGGDYRYPGDGVRGHSGYWKSRLDKDKRDFYSGGAFPFRNDDVSCGANKRGNSAAVTAEKEMGKGVEPELKSLRNDVAVFVFDKTDEHHNGASDEGNYVAEKNVHLIFLRFSFFSDLQNAVSGGNDGENVESRRNKVKMADIINSPENKGENNYGFEPYYIFGVDIPGEKNGFMLLNDIISAYEYISKAQKLGVS